MIKRPTWILLVLLLLVIGAYIFIKNRPASSSTATPTALGDNFLITDADGALQSLSVKDAQGNVINLREPGGTWMIVQPTTETADQALASAADTQVGALRIITMLDQQPDPDVVQLSNPAHTIELTFASGTQHRLDIGMMTLTGSGYYVRLDDGNIYVVSQSGIDSLLNLLTAPPYPATETPTLAPTSKPTATPGLSSPTPTP